MPRQLIIDQTIDLAPGRRPGPRPAFAPSAATACEAAAPPVRGSHHRRAPSSGRQRYRGARTGSSPYRGIRFARAKSIRLRDSILTTPEPKSASRCAKQPLLVDRVCPTGACARTAESRKRGRGACVGHGPPLLTAGAPGRIRTPDPQIRRKMVVSDRRFERIYDCRETSGETQAQDRFRGHRMKPVGHLWS